MDRLLRLLTGIYMCLALGLGGVAHAAEDSGAALPEICVIFGCADTDSDQHAIAEQHGDDDHSQDHGSDDACTCHAHGGCHGHHQLSTVKDHSLPLHSAALAMPHAFDRDMLPLEIWALMLRPPIA